MTDTTSPYRDLQRKLGLKEDLPYTPNWSAAADFLGIISEHCLQHAPETILECSCGITTLVLSRCCQINGRGRIISLEDGAEFAAQTRTALQCLKTDRYAEIHDAPLHTVHCDATDFLWYELDNIAVETIDMLVIDGPSGYIQPLSRYPALPMLYEYLSPYCTIFLDDAARPDEQQIVAKWRTRYPSLGLQYLELDRGCAILNRDSRSNR